MNAAHCDRIAEPVCLLARITHSSSINLRKWSWACQPFALNVPYLHNRQTADCTCKRRCTVSLPSPCSQGEPSASRIGQLRRRQLFWFISTSIPLIARASPHHRVPNPLISHNHETQSSRPPQTRRPPLKLVHRENSGSTRTKQARIITPKERCGSTQVPGTILNQPPCAPGIQPVR